MSHANSIRPFPSYSTEGAVQERDRRCRGGRCRPSGRYRVYQQTKIGLQPTRYRRDVPKGHTLPPAPGKGEVFLLETPFEIYDGGQLSLFPFATYLDEPFDDDGDALPMAE